jgi:2'-5' RNA ligase
MGKTIIADSIGKEVIAYGVVAFLSKEFQIKIAELTDALQKELPEILWITPPEALHITLFEIVMPLREYRQDKDQIYFERASEIDKEIAKSLLGLNPITVTFNILEASLSAITAQGTDNGAFQRIRNCIVNKGLLPPETRTPPDIIHSSIARYSKSVDLEVVQVALKSHSLNFQETIREFVLVKDTKTPLLKYETVKVYPLNS